jgi:Glycosyl hydrolases family 28
MVRNPGRPWDSLPVYGAKVTQVIDTKGTTRETAMAYFDFSGKAEVSVTYNKAPIRSVRIRPLSYGIQPEIRGNTIMLSLSQPRNLSIEVNGDIFDNLQLFAGTADVREPNPSDTNLIYFGPGIHTVGVLKVPSGKTVYITGGAVVQGQLLISRVENVRVLGRGILTELLPDSGNQSHRPRNDALTVEYAKNVEIGGVIVMPRKYSVLIGQSAGVTIRGLKSLSFEGNADGIDVFCSTGVLIDSVFMRNSDDCIALYGHRWNYYGNVNDVTVSHSTLWADMAHPIVAGTHGDPPHPDTLERLRFVDIDVLDQHESQLDYQGCMSLNAGDANLIRNVVFDHIRVEDFREGQLVNLRVMYNRKYNTAPGQGIEDVLFKDVTYRGANANISVITGYDDTRAIRNITFENLSINGRMISDTMTGKPGYYKTSDMARFFIGEHVDNVTFTSSGLP